MLRTLIHFLSRWWGRRRPAVAVKLRRRAILQLEALEDRWVPSTISGFVYHDPTDTGPALGQQGIGGATITLEDQSGNSIESTTTNPDGSYNFTNDPRIGTTAPPIIQNLNFPNPPADQSGNPTYLKTGQSQSQTINQFNPSLGKLTGIDIISQGTMNSGVTFENTDGTSDTPTDTITETLTLTANGTIVPPLATDLSQTYTQTLNPGSQYTSSVLTPGQQQSQPFNDPNAANPANTSSQDWNQILSEFEGTGTVTFTESALSKHEYTSSGNGSDTFFAKAAASVQVIYYYQPSKALPPGNYKIVETTPSGYLDDKQTINHHEIDITLTSGNDSTGNNFGALLPATLSGYDYYDANNNGKMQPLSGIGGVGIQLKGTDDTGTAVNLTAPPNGTTGSDGSYSFTNLRPGTYSLTQTTTPAGFINGIDSPGTQGSNPPGKDASGNPILSGINLSDGTQGQNNNFGEIKPGSLSGVVYNDSNNDGSLESGEPGINGVTVTLTGTTANGQTVQPQTETTANVNGIDGVYSFDNLQPGTYQITKQTPQGYVDGLANQPGSLGGTAVSDEVFSKIGLTANTSGVNYNFGEILPGQLSGFVYDDASGNVGQSAPPAGTGIGGVTVNLMKGTQLIQTATTKQDGSYDFFGLLPGTYSIAKVDTQGWAYIDDKVTVGTQQTGNATGNNINGITVASGTNGSFNNFSEVKGGTLSGTVFIDKNNTGVLQTGDKGVQGVRVNLSYTDAIGNTVTLHTTTDANGFYQFTGLLSGDYTITKIPPAGYLDGMLQPTAGIVAGSPDGNVLADQFTNISLPPENSGDQYNFAELQLPSPPPNIPPPSPIPPPVIPPFFKYWYMG